MYATVSIIMSYTKFRNYNNCNNYKIFFQMRDETIALFWWTDLGILLYVLLSVFKVLCMKVK